MNKSDLRVEYIKKRMNISSIEWEKNSQKIHNLLFSRFPIHNFSYIHLYLSNSQKNEVDTTRVWKTLKQDFPVEVFTSYFEEKTKRWFHTSLKADTSLKISKYGIPEPVNPLYNLDAEMFFKQIKNEKALIICPLLIFDRGLNRLGYGKGIYDEFLSHQSPFCLKVGLSHFEPVVEIGGLKNHDIPMDYCITPDRIWRKS